MAADPVDYLRFIPSSGFDYFLHTGFSHTPYNTRSHTIYRIHGLAQTKQTISDNMADTPHGTSPTLTLVPATPAERLAVLNINSSAWKGPLTVADYIAREDHLLKQQLTGSRLTCWILVDRAQPVNNRTILSSCETFEKNALVAYNGVVEERVPTYGVGSVFCRKEFRGLGYAKRMIEELCRVFDGKKVVDGENGVDGVDGVGKDQGKREKPLFTILFSDIGKKFYAQFGWKPFPSAHVSLSSIDETEFKRDLPGVDLPLAQTSDLTATDVRKAMCSEEVAQRQREALRVASEESPGTAKVAIEPDYDHFCWHWAREEFYSERLRPDKGQPLIKGAGHDGVGVYCAWNRNFGEQSNENTLFILRWTYEDPKTPAQTQATIEAMAAILRRAQHEAHEWGMATVEFWNPTLLMQKAVSLLDPTIQVVHREQSSIASLRWTGAENGLGDDVEWLWNEKYAWC